MAVTTGRKHDVQPEVEPLAFEVYPAGTPSVDEPTRPTGAERDWALGELRDLVVEADQANQFGYVLPDHFVRRLRQAVEALS